MVVHCVGIQPLVCPLQRKKAKAGPAMEAEGLTQAAVGVSDSSHATDSASPTALPAAVDAASGPQIASDAHTTAHGTPATEAAPAKPTMLDLPFRPDAVRLVLNSLRQQPEQEKGAESHHKVTVHLPGRLLKNGSLWLQAQNGNGISEPFATPRYAVIAEQLSTSVYQDEWRRYMYSTDLLRRTQ